MQLYSYRESGSLKALNDANINDKGNLLKLTVLSYLLTFTTGAAVILPFILKGSAAHALMSTPTSIGFAFSFYMVGMLVTQFLNGFIVRYIRLAHELLLITLVYSLCIVALFSIHSIVLLAIVIFGIGLCFGAIVTIPNYIMIAVFQGTRRTSRLNRLDLFFSIGSFVYPMLAAYMLAMHFSWTIVYASIIVLLAAVLILLRITVLPIISHAHHHTAPKSYSKWNINVYFVGGAMLLYFISYVGFTYWLQPYLQNTLHFPIKNASFGISLFWIFYGIGCLISSYMVRFIKLHRYIMSSLIIACIAYYGILHFASTTTLLFIWVAILGLGCSTVYSSTIAFGSMLLERPSPRLISFYITLSGIGTFAGQFFSSYIYKHFSFNFLTLLSGLAMLIAVALYGIVSYRIKRHA